MNSNHMDTTNSSTAKELKKQVMNDLNRVKDDLEEIKQRLTPGQMIDEALHFEPNRSDPGKIFAQLKANPIGTSFLTIGTILLMEDRPDHSYEVMMKERGSKVKEKISGAMSQAKGKVAEVKDEIKSTVARKKEQVNDVMSQAQDKVSDIRGEAGESMETRAGHLQGVKNKLKGVKDELANKSHQAIEAGRNLDPLTYLALGAGLGILTGSTLPVSSSEKEAVDSVFEDRMSQFSSELKDVLNQSVNVFKKEVLGGITDFNLNLF